MAVGVGGVRVAVALGTAVAVGVGSAVAVALGVTVRAGVGSEVDPPLHAANTSRLMGTTRNNTYRFMSSSSIRHGAIGLLHDVSASLSHLFAQGSTSADLLLMSPEYRQEAITVIRAAEQEREAMGVGTFNGRFSTFSTDAITPANYEVVYAIIERWNGLDLVSRLPFFSKVNLRTHAEDLRRMGFRVSQKRIDVVD